MGLTPERKAALMAERKALFAELKRRLSDRGIAGIPHSEFIHRWRGVPLDEPEGNPTLDQGELSQLRDATRRRLDGTDISPRGGVAWPVTRDISDATWDRIDRELGRPCAKDPALGILGLKLQRHWETYLPKMTAELRAAGTLESRLHETAEQMLDQEATMIQQGMSPDQARETTREIGFLPEEDSEAEPPA